MDTNEVSPAPPLVQCSVTGKMVPEDEIVTIQGYRVCAEGKAILLERLKSGEAMPGELETPTFLRRFLCYLLDSLIINLPVWIVNRVLTVGGASSQVLGIVSLIGSTIQVVYFAQLHGTLGHSVGKMAGKLKVVNEDGSKISLKTAYVRALAYLGPGILGGFAVLSGAIGLVLVTGVIVLIWFLADIIFALVDRAEQRSLHDRIAGTRVVERE